MTAGAEALAPRPRRPFWLLALLTGSAAIGMHVFVPALPLIAREFQVDPARTQLTISLYMFVIAAGQLVYGPLSDRLGRRPVLIAALSLFVAAGLGCAMAQSFESLILARCLQAAGGCAGLVLGRAIIHDTTQGTKAASTVAMVNAVLLISPTLSPILGTWAADTWGWRSVPLILVAMGTTTVLGIIFLMSETNTSAGQSVREIAARYARLVRNPAFLVQVAGGSLTTTTMFTLLSASPFVVIEQLDRPLSDAAYFYTVFVIGLLVGNLGSARVLRRLGFDVTFLVASLVGVAGALLLLVPLWGQNLTTAAFVAGGFLYTLMAGTMAPLTLTRAVGMSPELRGSAAGFFGAAQFTAGASCVTLSGLSSNISLASAALLFCCATGGSVIYGVLLFRGRT